MSGVFLQRISPHEYGLRGRCRSYNYRRPTLSQSAGFRRSREAPMPQAGKPEVLIVGKIPADLRQALAAQFELVEGWSLREQSRKQKRGYRIAITTGMDGFDAALDGSAPGSRADRIAGRRSRTHRLRRRRSARHRRSPARPTSSPRMSPISPSASSTPSRDASPKPIVSCAPGAGDRNASRRRRACTARTPAIVGMGRIGTAIARRAAGIGMDRRLSRPAQEAGPALYVSLRTSARWRRRRIS